jgi:hypothetical protein
MTSRRRRGPPRQTGEDRSTQVTASRSGSAGPDLHHQQPGVTGTLRAGFPMSSANYVFIDEDNAWLLYQLTEHVTEAWKVRLGVV